MKLYIECNNYTCSRKIYLNVQAKSRRELANKWGYNFFIRCSHCGKTHSYNVNSVYAESVDDSTVGGAVIGGLIGLLGGPIGLLVGGTLGGAIGNSNEKDNANKFNRNYV
jgi:hypothetical protein